MSRCSTLAKTARSTANSKPRPWRSSPNTAAMPSRSQIRPNSIGPPMRVQATRPAAISDRITARSQCRTSEAARRSSSPLRQQHVLTAKRADDPLAHPTALPLVLDKIEIGMASRRLLADKHRRVVRGFADNIEQKLISLLKMFH